MNDKARGYASVWKRDGGKVKASGQISIKPEVLREWLNLPVDSYGCISLDLVLFMNDRATNERSPQYTGYLHVGTYQKENRPSQSAAPAQQSSAEEKPLAEYDDIPF